MAPLKRLVFVALALAGLAATPAHALVALEAGTVTAGSSAVTVNLANTYDQAVVVCSGNYTNNVVPVVVRVSNVTRTSFDVRLDAPSGGFLASEIVSYLVMEEGVWDVEGTPCEARLYTSTVTDETGAWVGEAQAYGQAYTNPVVLGQVMTENDPDWSVFWCSGGALNSPPSATTLVTGKTVGEDPNTIRADETVGYIVIEAGHGAIDGVEFEALVGPDAIKGIGNGAPSTYVFDAAFAAAPMIGVVTMAGVDNTDGGWAVTMGSPAATSTTLALGVDEDTLGDGERMHPPEQVGYAVFAGPLVYADPSCTIDSDGDGINDCDDGCPGDPDKVDPGVCGCGTPDTDTDDDGVADCIDNCPDTSNDQADCDDDGIGDACAVDPDCNDNGVPDPCDIASGTSTDADGDGIPDECDAPSPVLLSNATLEAQLLCVHDPLSDGPLWMTGGMAVGDFNRDGHPDLFAVTGGHDTDKLFINSGSGVFSEQGVAWGLTDTFVSNAAAVGDIDGDGWLDIYVTAFGANRLYRNNGDGTFTDIAADAGVDLLPAGVTASDSSVFGAAFGDYDLDGDLDLMVANWQSCCLFDCFGCGSGNRLYRNEGDLTFTDVTDSALGGAMDGVVGFQPCFVDMNSDRFPELLISADFESSRYLVNNGDGTFSDQTVSSGTGLDDNGMGQAVADFDNDLRMDWYVTSIHKDEPLSGDRVGNMLYRSTGAHVFEERSVDAGVNDGGWGWGTIAVDLDLDGLIDIVEVNGREAVDGQWAGEQAYVFRNNGDMTFTEIAQPSGFVHNDSGRAVVYMDAESDGDLDVVVFTAQGPLYYFRNDSSATGHRWLEVDLDTSNNPGLAPDGFGARLETLHDGQRRVRVVAGDPSYLGTSQLIAHFGFGTGASTLTELKIKWPRGQVTVITDVQIDRRITVHAPDPADITADGEVDVDDLVEVITGWGVVDGTTNLAADVDLDGEVKVDDLVAVIAAWGPSTLPLEQ